MSLRGREKLRDESFFFITTSVVNNERVFIHDACCQALVNNIKYYQKKYMFNILAYVIMPSHFHWILEVENKNGSVSDIMRDIKKYSAWDIMEILEKMNNFSLISVFEKYAANYKDRKRKFWQKRFDDQVIRNQSMFWVKLYYIHSNPVRAGIVYRPEAYKYSSARNYINNDHSILKVNTEMCGVVIK